MGVDQAFMYPTWFAEGFHLVEDPDVAYALARAYNNWVADFCKAAPDRLFAASMVPIQNMDYAIEELRRTAKMPCFKGAFIRPMFIEGHYFTHPYYDPLWAELESLGTTLAVHPTAGLWNPEWTSHGPFTEKVKGRLNQHSGIMNAGGGPFAGGGASSNFGLFNASPPLGHPIASGYLLLARQSYVRRGDTYRLHRHAALSEHESGSCARQSFVDGRSPGEDGSLDAHHSAAPSLSGAHRYRGDVERRQGHARLRRRGAAYS